MKRRDAVFGSGQLQVPHHLPCNFSNDLSRPASDPEILSQRSLKHPITAYHPSEAVSTVETAAGLIVQITNLLTDSSNNCRALAFESKSLHQTLTLAGLAIREYGNRPLGQGLANTFAPEVERCRVVLLELLDRINGTRRGLAFTSISNLWRPVFGSRWDGNELASLKKKLCHIRRSLGGLLMALNSYVLCASVFRG